MIRSTIASCLLCLAVLIAAWPQHGFAQAAFNTNAAGTVRANTASGAVTLISKQTIGTDTAVNSVCPPRPAASGWGRGFTSRVVGCMEAAIDAAAGRMIAGIFNFLRSAIYPAIALAFAVYGVALMYGGVEKPGASTFVLLLKVGIIYYFMVNFMDVYGGVVEGVRQSMRWGFSLIDNSPSFYCPPIAAAAQVQSMWGQIDCVLGGMIGAAPGIIIKSGLLGVFTAFLFSGAAGFMVFVIGYIFIMTLILGIVRAIHIYVVAYMGIALMMVFSPLFVPMILFRQTKPFFDKWLKLLMALALQPMFLFMFLGMILTTFDILVYKSPTSLYGIIAGSNAGCSVTASCPPQYSMNPTAPAAARRFSMVAYLTNGSPPILTNELRLGMLIDLKPPAAGAPVGGGTTDTGWFGSIWAEAKATLDTMYTSVKTSLIETLSNLSIKIPIKLVDFQAMWAQRGEGVVVWPAYGRVDYLNTTALPTPGSITGYVAASGIPPADQDLLTFKWRAMYYLLLQTFLCALMAYVFYVMLQFLPELTHSIVGGVFNTPNLYQVTPLPFEGKMGSTVTSMGVQFAPGASTPPPQATRPRSSRRR